MSKNKRVGESTFGSFLRNATDHLLEPILQVFKGILMFFLYIFTALIFGVIGLFSLSFVSYFCPKETYDERNPRMPFMGSWKIENAYSWVFTEFDDGTISGLKHFSYFLSAIYFLLGLLFFTFGGSILTISLPSSPVLSFFWVGTILTQILTFYIVYYLKHYVPKPAAQVT